MCRSARAELTQLSHTIARRTARLLERQGLLERDAEQTYFTGEAVAASDPFDLLGFCRKRRNVSYAQEGKDYKVES